MSAQESLTLLFDTIALSFIAIAALDLGQEIIVLYRQVFIAPVQLPSIENQSQPLSQLPDPWLLPAAEAVAPAQITPAQPKLVLLLAEAKAVEKVRVENSGVTAEGLLESIDVDTLKLRDARKLAKALGIAQKTNGKDQKLAFLRGQIKLKLQQERLPRLEDVAQLKVELSAC